MDDPKWYFTRLDSPVGWIRIEGNDAGITAVQFSDEEPGESEHVPEILLECRKQLEEYFEGNRQDFDLPLAPEGTDFQQAVWNVLLGVPFGRTSSYLDVASLLQNEKAVRAVGAANGRNPIAIVVPCHRIIGSNGKLTGYAGKVWRKKWLLEHEAKFTYGQQQSLF